LQRPRNTAAEWIDEILRKAEELYSTGKLESWDEIFGKPFPGKRRKGLFTRSRSAEILLEFYRLKKQNDMPTDTGLFEQVAANLKIGKKKDGCWTGWATVRDICNEYTRGLGGSHNLEILIDKIGRLKGGEDLKQSSS
jgi:hypothetical protein